MCPKHRAGVSFPGPEESCCFAAARSVASAGQHGVLQPQSHQLAGCSAALLWSLQREAHPKLTLIPRGSHSPTACAETHILMTACWRRLLKVPPASQRESGSACGTLFTSRSFPAFASERKSRALPRYTGSLFLSTEGNVLLQLRCLPELMSCPPVAI